MAKRKNLIGQKFERLTVVKRGDDIICPSGKKDSAWWCLCDCQLSLPEEMQKLVLIRQSSLVTGGTKSCGCIRREIIIESNKNGKKYNKYDLSGDYGIGWTSNTNEEFYFDLEDYDKIKNYCWFEHKCETNDGIGYIKSNDENNRTIELHRLVMGIFDINIRIDHIKHRLNDNRKSQLRIATGQENSFNQKLNKNNTSGVTGVYWKERDKKWIATIGLNYKKIHLGQFTNKADAIRARREAEERYFGEWSYNNSMKKGD